MTVHTIPVPDGWSVEQAWEAICRDDKMPPPVSWSVILVSGGKLVKVVR